jgi:Ca2+-binding EF-hand superfamily protein
MATRFTEAEAKEQFSIFDREGTGRIAAGDLGMLIRSLGENPT